MEGSGWSRTKSKKYYYPRTTSRGTCSEEEGFEIRVRRMERKISGMIHTCLIPYIMFSVFWFYDFLDSVSWSQDLFLVSLLAIYIISLYIPLNPLAC